MRPWTVLPLLFSLCACGPADLGERDASPFDGGREESDGDVPVDAPLDDATTPPNHAPDPSLTDVSHDRQIRGAWVPSVWNIVFPSRSGLTQAQARAELTTILDAMEQARMNALFLQIRPESDALYQSSLEPWSRYLTGTQGNDPGYDPLAIALELAHGRGIEVHAWINPYRGMASTSATRATNHVTRTLSSYAYTYGTQIFMDPGAQAVRDHVVAVVRDVITRYDVDGIHFDDYFYPYPVAGQTFPDGATYAAYTDAGGTLSRDDWRRQNVHLLVEAVSAAIAAERDDVRFGISPFGIHRPGSPPGITGLDAYAAIYCDPLPWLENEWIDYLAPQLYWPTTQTAQAFIPLLEWWAAQTTDARPILAGYNLVKLGETDAWSVDEFRAELSAVNERAAMPVRGSIAYHVEPLVENRMGIRDVIRAELFTAPALPPVLPRAIGAAPPPPPTVALAGTTATITADARAEWIAVYTDGAIVRTVPATTTGLELAPGTHAITVVDGRGLESRGRLITVP